MCKFCTVENGNCESLRNDRVEIKIGKRTMEHWSLETFINNDEGRYSIEASVFMDGGDSISDVSIPINFCPFCGRKL